MTNASGEAEREDRSIYGDEPYLSLAFCDNPTDPITHIPIIRNDWFGEKRPVYYPEFVGLPTTEIVQHKYNPVAA